MSHYQKVFSYTRITDHQTPRKKYQHIQYERDMFNPYQNFLYKRALFGLSIYSPDELANMKVVKKKRIQRVHKRAQEVLNLWKQEISHVITSNFLSKVFFHSKLAKEYRENYANTTDVSYISHSDFKSMGITKQQIINKLIEEKVLPYNFYDLENLHVKS